MSNINPTSDKQTKENDKTKEQRRKTSWKARNA